MNELILENPQLTTRSMLVEGETHPVIEGLGSYRKPTRNKSQVEGISAHAKKMATTMLMRTEAFMLKALYTTP